MNHSETESMETEMAGAEPARGSERAKETDNSRRAAMKGMVAAGALMPLSGKLTAPAQDRCEDIPAECREQIEECQRQLRLDPERFVEGARIIQRVIRDPDFRQDVKANPVETLARMGVILADELADEMRREVAANPDLLVDVLLVENAPPFGFGEEPAVVAGVVVYVTVVVVVQTASFPGELDERLVAREKVAGSFINQLFAGCDAAFKKD